MAAIAYPNSRIAAERRALAGQVSWPRTLAMLAGRLAAFALFQGLFALAFWLRGAPSPWQASIAWWPWTCILTNCLFLILLRRLARAEGLRLVDLFHAGPLAWKRDLPVMLLFFLLAGPLAWLPNQGLAGLIFGDPTAPSRMMFLPLPYWALIPALVLFPVTVALAELTTYAGYVMPRVEALSGKPWLAVGLAGFFLALQHTALPLILDGRYLAWRLLMFLPFAIYVLATIHWRPRLLPLWMIGHGLIDALTVLMVLFATQGTLY